MQSHYPTSPLQSASSQQQQQQPSSSTASSSSSNNNSRPLPTYYTDAAATRDRRRTYIACFLVILGSLTIIITLGTNHTVVSEWFERANEPDFSHLDAKVMRAEEACDSASKHLRAARVTTKSNTSIFVSVASYRDEECAPTLLDMYQRAKRPQDIYVGIVEQHDAAEGDPSCIPPEWSKCQHDKWCPTDNVRIRKVMPKDAKGPTYGRYVGALMYEGERFYMMIDSHNRFVTHWDEVAISMYLKIPYPKPVLSHYPEAWHNPKDKGQQTNAPLDNRPTTTYLCKARVLPGLGYLRLDGFVVSRKSKVRPQPWAAAGFLFAYGRLLQDVPFDPHLDFVFDGEEILYSARMWTSGWNMYSPSENILYHYYYRTKAKRFWSLLPGDWGQRRDAAQRRIQYFLEIYKLNTTEPLIPKDTTEQGVIVEKEKYGLGKVRPIRDWYAWIGVDRRMWRTQEEKFCRMYS